MRRAIYIVIATLAAGGMFLFILMMSAEEEKPNILLISLDTVRADHLGCYGYDRHTTPALDALSKQGVLFKKHIASSSWTLPSHATLFTGLYPPTHRAETLDHMMAPKLPTMAQLIDSLGYKTAAFVSSGYLGPAFGLHRGFNRFYSLKDVLNKGTETITDKGLEWLKEVGVKEKETSKPFFLFLHYLDAHTPYDPPEPFRDFYYDENWKTEGNAGDESVAYAELKEKTPQFKIKRANRMKAFYDGEIARIDRGVEQIIDFLKERDVFQNTLMIITSDHGEEFIDHGSFDHGQTLYSEQIDVPLLVIWPDEIEGGRIDGSLTRSVDILPTVLDLIDAPPYPVVHGRSLKKNMHGRNKEQARMAVADLKRKKFDMTSLSDGRYKYIVQSGEESDELLFDIQSDPAERNNVVEEKGDIVEEFRRAYDQWTDEMKQWGHATRKSRLTLEEIEQLQALGYMQDEE